MKKSVITFNCDSCGKEHISNEEIEFPKNWLKINEIDMKVDYFIDYKDKNLHFCSPTCLFNYLEKELEDRGVLQIRNGFKNETKKEVNDEIDDIIEVRTSPMENNPKPVRGWVHKPDPLNPITKQFDDDEERRRMF